ncbi:hypothetical protein CAP35_08805 [Chitinophagaceae bacterium IBVUCB1]|nr:hypothetical protein CAP35_08805 [Chitinophagaceae bacterium IBVUCB1]
MKSLYVISSICLVLLLGYAQVSAQGIIIPTGSYVIQENGNLCTANNFTNNGSFSANGGTVVFTGSTQSINGSTETTFNNITVSTGSTTTVSSANQKLKAILKSNGTLNCGGNLTLLSTSTQTALVDGTGTGSVSGNLIMQRYLASRFGYKYFSSPFTSATVNEFSNEITLSASFPPVYKYDENLPSNGWYHYAASTNTMFPLYGYAINFGNTSSALTVDMTGVVSNGTVSTTLYNNNQTYTQGFNLVGNPYPSPIDWNAASGWTKTNIDDAIYYFDASSTDQYTGTYSSYINGVSSNGIANNIIPAMQAFFVHVSNGTFPVTATFAVNNNVRINNFNPTFHKSTGNSQPTMRIKAKYATEEGFADNMVIYFDEYAKLHFDKEFDALKINNTDTRSPNIYTISPDNQSLSINAMPYPHDNTVVIPLGIETAKDGQLIISLQDIQNFPSNLKTYIVDRQTMAYELFSDTKTYTINLKEGVVKNRFAIVFTHKDIEDTELIQHDIKAYYTAGNLHVMLDLHTGESGTLKLYSISGQLLHQSKIAGYGDHSISAPYSTGVYMLSFEGDKQVMNKKVFIGND